MYICIYVCIYAYVCIYVSLQTTRPSQPAAHLLGAGAERTRLGIILRPGPADIHVWRRPGETADNNNNNNNSSFRGSRRRRKRCSMILMAAFRKSLSHTHTSSLISAHTSADLHGRHRGSHTGDFCRQETQERERETRMAQTNRKTSTRWWFCHPTDGKSHFWFIQRETCGRIVYRRREGSDSDGRCHVALAQLSGYLGLYPKKERVEFSVSLHATHACYTWKHTVTCGRTHARRIAPHWPRFVGLTSCWLQELFCRSTKNKEKKKKSSKRGNFVASQARCWRAVAAPPGCCYISPHSSTEKDRSSTNYTQPKATKYLEKCRLRTGLMKQTDKLVRVLTTSPTPQQVNHPPYLRGGGGETTQRVFKSDGERKVRFSKKEKK